MNVKVLIHDGGLTETRCEEGYDITAPLMIVGDNSDEHAADDDYRRSGSCGVMTGG